MKEDGRHSRELVEQYVYIMYKDSRIVQKIAQDGLKTRELSFNSLGKIFVYNKRTNKKHCFNGNEQKNIEKGMPNSNDFLP
jgi:hypothetical protein